MMKKFAIWCLLAASLAGTAWAQGPDRPSGIPQLDHVFVIMMENHGYLQVVSNPNEPYLNGLIAGRKVNLATNYFAVGHPSLTNYLEIVGGSNFGVRSDNSPDWGNRACSPNIEAGTVNADGPLPGQPGPPPGVILDPSPVICPISGVGMDADTPAVDNWNEIYPPSNFFFLADLDGVKSVAAARGVPLREFVTQAVKDKLAASSTSAERPWVKYMGKLKHLHKEAELINRPIEEDSLAGRV